MQKEFSYIVDGMTYRGIAEQVDRPWGNALDIKTFDAQGNLRDLIGFACHPEFDGFDELQSKTADELLAHAIEILNSGEIETSLQDARQHGFTLLLRLNGVNR